MSLQHENGPAAAAGDQLRGWCYLIFHTSQLSHKKAAGAFFNGDNPNPTPTFLLPTPQQDYLGACSRPDASHLHG